MRHLRENLLVQFSVVSFVIMAVMAMFLAITLSNKIRADAINDLVDEAVGSTEGRLLRAITPNDLEGLMRGERYDEFNEFVLRSILSDRTALVKLWSNDGTIVYSTEREEVGTKFPNNENLRRALRGERAVEIEAPGTPGSEQLPSRYRDVPLVEVYTPINFPDTSEPLGVFEIYQFYQPTIQRIESLRNWVFASIGVGFLVLYGGLVSVVWNGWRIIAGQRRRLQEVNIELEKQVQDRSAALRELQEAQERLVRAERLAAIGELAGGVAHELRNPLGTIKNAVYYLKGRLSNTDLTRDNPRVGEYLEIMEEEVETSNGIITDLMDFARVNPPDLAPASLETVVDHALSRTELKASVRVVKEFDPDLPLVSVDREQLRRALGNLLANASDAMPDGGQLTITAKANDSFVELQLHDTGQGISDSDLAKIFDPLFTTKAKGVGLGLTIVRELIQKQQGTIDVSSKPGQGTTFRVRLAVSNQPQRPEEEEISVTSPSQAG